MKAVELQRLRRRFRHTEAVRDLDLEIPEGEVFALLGPNGAGKSTTVKVLVNILRPSAGRAMALGVESTRLTPRDYRKIGYVSEDQRLPGWMTVGGILDYCRPLYPDWDDDLCVRLRKMFDLPLNRRIRTLSRGMRVKAAMLSSLSYRPRLLVLDEPFSGLDPVVREDLIEGMLELCERDSWTFLICSQEIDEVEKLADRVGFLRAGRLLLAENVGSLLDRFREVELMVAEECELPGDLPPEWLNPKRFGRVIRFAVSNYRRGLTEAEVASRFPNGAQVTVTRLSLKSIYVALARAGSVAASSAGRQPLAADPRHEG